MLLYQRSSRAGKRPGRLVQDRAPGEYRRLPTSNCQVFLSGNKRPRLRFRLEPKSTDHVTEQAGNTSRPAHLTSAVTYGSRRGGQEFSSQGIPGRWSWRGFIPGLRDAVGPDASHCRVIPMS